MLREQDIALRLPANGKWAALAGISACLADKAARTQEEVLAALVDRERLGSTGIGNGVAVPHGRMECLDSPLAALATLERPVTFGSPDDAPVDVVLALLWPKSGLTGFLPSLSNFARLLRQPGLLKQLRASEQPTEAFCWLEQFDCVGIDCINVASTSVRPCRDAEQ